MFGNIISLAFLFFAPGLALSFAFIKKTAVLDRVAVSFALSVTAVPLLVFYLSALGMPVTFPNVIMVIAALVLACWTRRLWITEA